VLSSTPPSFSSVFGRKAGYIDDYRVEVVGFNLGAEARGTVIGERNAINDELGLV
jgi:hypothetical protein